MKKKKTKKAVAITLAVGLLAGMLPGTGAEVQAAPPGPGVGQFATKDQLLNSNNFSLDKDENGVAKKVHFGKDAGWYIAGGDPGNRDGLVLMCGVGNDNPFPIDQLFNSSKNNKTFETGWNCAYNYIPAPQEVFANHYGGSELRDALKGIETDTNYFSAEEQAKMLETKITTNDTKNGDTYVLKDKLYVPYAANRLQEFVTVGTNDKINYPNMSPTELDTGLHVDLTGSKSPYNNPADRAFWLRTPNLSTAGSMYIYTAGPGNFVEHTSVNQENANPSQFAITPAFQLDMTDVLFASIVPPVDSASVDSSGELPLADGSFTLRYESTTIGSVYTFPDKKDCLEIRGAQPGTKLVLQSALNTAWVFDVTDKIYDTDDLFPGAGLTSFDGFKIWLEKTDAASRITSATLAKEADWHKVTVTPGNNMSRVSNTGAETQYVVKGTMMTPIHYTADDGYYFPTDYNSTQSMDENGITVTRDDERRITVQGTPTAAADIILAPATKIPYAIKAEPDSIDFGTVVESYKRPDAKTVTITNTGTETISLTSITSGSGTTNYEIGQLTTNSLNSGEKATFTIQPKGSLSAGTYKETITIETNKQVKAAVDVSFTVTKKPEVYRVTVTPGKNMSRDNNSGKETQNVLEKTSIADVVYTADDGYYFPADYTSKVSMDKDGITVKRVSSTQITVGGTPTKSTDIALASATKATYTIKADLDSIDFGTVEEGYKRPDAKTVTITNTGNNRLTLMPPTSRIRATGYEAGQLSATALNPGETATFTIQPKANLTEGTYQETFTIETDKKTRATVNVSFTVTKKPLLEVTVTVTPGKNMSRVQNSGGETQKVGQNTSITDILYTADDGYYFPENYNSDASMNKDGITVVRDSSTQITVSGTPTKNTQITLTPATKSAYSIKAAPDSIDFGTLEEGYKRPGAKTVTITNTGTNSLSLMPPAGGNKASNYEAGKLSAATLDPGQAVTFTIQPKADLAAGTYKEVFTIETDKQVQVTVNVSFTVNKKTSAEPGKKSGEEGKPGQDSKPDQTDKPASASKTPTKTGVASSPKTGDNSNLFLWLAMLTLSAGGVTTVFIKKFKRTR